ncbi:hypothetical protein C8R42DRAFT_716219 [Lentinula raphanica]|nr:hypothetical protein C8R42DRAFT_716219 [Lentinula raphanica]
MPFPSLPSFSWERSTHHGRDWERLTHGRDEGRDEGYVKESPRDVNDTSSLRRSSNGDVTLVSSTHFQSSSLLSFTLQSGHPRILDPLPVLLPHPATLLPSYPRPTSSAPPSSPSPRNVIERHLVSERVLYIKETQQRRRRGGRSPGLNPNRFDSKRFGSDSNRFGFLVAWIVNKTIRIEFRFGSDSNRFGSSPQLPGLLYLVAVSLSRRQALFIVSLSSHPESLTALARKKQGSGG